MIHNVIVVSHTFLLLLERTDVQRIFFVIRLKRIIFTFVAIVVFGRRSP